MDSTGITGLESLREALFQRGKMTESEIAKIFEKTTLKQFNKGDIITAEGRIENYIGLVLDGLVRVHFYKNDKDHSLDFFFPSSLVSSLESFLTRQPSTLIIEALTPVTLMRLHHDDLQKLYAESSKLQETGRIFTEEIFKRLSQRVQDLIALSATERYVKLLEAQPEYIQQIPLKYLASYLNITPESLSRIRKNVL